MEKKFIEVAQLVPCITCDGIVEHILQLRIGRKFVSFNATKESFICSRCKKARQLTELADSRYELATLHAGIKQ